MSQVHDHAPSSFGKAFAFGIALNAGFVILEAFYGWHARSLALLADAAHNLSDVGGLLLAWAAFAAARLRPNVRHTYGWRRGSILASFANATLLLVAMGSLAWEAIQRLQSPAPMDAPVVMLVATIGVLVNATTAWLFMGGKKDLNIRGAFMHMAADALVSLGVVIAGGLYWWYGWMWIDPIVSLLVALAVVAGTWSLFHRSLHLLFDGVPHDIDVNAVRESLLKVSGVVGIHDLHVWAMSTSDNAMTAHLVIDSGAMPSDAVLEEALAILHKNHELWHVTLQIETPDLSSQCPLNETH